MLFFKVILFLTSVIQLSYGHSTGADNDSCATMLPDHGPFGPSGVPPPFTITISASAISPGQQLTVTIARTHADTQLRGFVIQGRTPDGVMTGQFLIAPGTRFMTCPGALAAASLTHAVSEDRATITLTWVPTPGFAGIVSFHLTAVEDFFVFWTGIVSAPVTVS